MNDDNEMDDLWSEDDDTGTSADAWTDAEAASGDGSWTGIGGQGSMDDMARTLSTFGMRIDALVTSTTSYRAAITDRLVEYADTVNKLVKNQSSDLEEHRSANQRLLTELQRGIATSDDSIARLTERIDELLSAGPDDSSRQVLVEVRSVLDAQERLGQFLTEALDQFGDRVTERLDAGQTGAVDQLDSLARTLSAVQTSDQAMESNLQDVVAEMRSMRDALVDLASGDVVAALWDEVRALRETLSGLSPAVAAPGAPSAEISQLTDAVSKLLDAAEVVPADDPDGLGTVAGDLAQLRADLSEGLLVEPDAALTDALDEIRSQLGALDDRVSAALTDAAGGDDPGTKELQVQISELTDEVRTLLSQVEIVGTDPGDPAGPPVTDERLDEVVATVSALRDSLAQGVDARPTSELTDALALIRSGVDGLGTRLDDLAAEADGLRWPGGAAASTGDDPESVLDRLAEDLASARTDVAAIGARLEEGLVVDVATSGDTDLADRVAALRDEVTAELEAVRQILADAVERPSTLDLSALATRDDLRSELTAALAGRGDSEPGEVEMVLDLDPVVALVDELREEIRSIPGLVTPAAPPPAADASIADLRDEIRALADVPESVAESVRTELVALRRRIKVRTDADILSDEQLDRIAQAVADRLS